MKSFLILLSVLALSYSAAFYDRGVDKTISLNKDGTITITTGDGKKVVISHDQDKRFVDVLVEGPNFEKNIQIDTEGKGYIIRQMIEKYEGKVDTHQFHDLLDKVQEYVQNGNLDPRFLKALEYLQENSPLQTSTIRQVINYWVQNAIRNHQGKTSQYQHYPYSYNDWEVKPWTTEWYGQKPAEYAAHIVNTDPRLTYETEMQHQQEAHRYYIPMCTQLLSQLHHLQKQCTYIREQLEESKHQGQVEVHEQQKHQLYELHQQQEITQMQLEQCAQHCCTNKQQCILESPQRGTWSQVLQNYGQQPLTKTTQYYWLNKQCFATLQGIRQLRNLHQQQMVIERQMEQSKYQGEYEYLSAEEQQVEQLHYYKRVLQEQLEHYMGYNPVGQYYQQEMMGQHWPNYEQFHQTIGRYSGVVPEAQQYRQLQQQQNWVKYQMEQCKAQGQTDNCLQVAQQWETLQKQKESLQYQWEQKNERGPWSHQYQEYVQKQQPWYYGTRVQMPYNYGLTGY